MIKWQSGIFEYQELTLAQLIVLEELGLLSYGDVKTDIVFEDNVPEGEWYAK